jgi:hypothetical protein
MYNDEFTKFSLFKLATFVFFWLIYPVIFLVYKGIFYSFLISFKGIKLRFLFDDETITTPNGVDRYVITTIILFPIRFVFHSLFGLSMSVVLYVVHLIPWLGILPELGNFLSCNNFQDLKRYLFDPFSGSSIPIMYYNKNSSSYDEDLTKRESIKCSNTHKEKISIKKFIPSLFWIICSPIVTVILLLVSIVIWLYRELVIYAIKYSFKGLYTNGRYINSFSHRSEYWLEQDDNKTTTKLLIIPRILFRILSIPFQLIFIVFVPPTILITLPFGYFNRLFIFIKICVKLSYESNKDTLYTLIKNEYFSGVNEEVIGGLKV